MSARGRVAAATWAAGLALAGMGGCSSTASFPYDRDTVWTVAVAEAAVWRPTLIDERNYRIVSEKTDLAGLEWEYRLHVGPDLNLFARRPSSRVDVSIRQTKPSRRRFLEDEKRFLAKLGISLAAMVRTGRR